MSAGSELFMEVKIPSDITEYKLLNDIADDFNKPLKSLRVVVEVLTKIGKG